ncbi:MAG: hypothetical protein JZU49_01155, partial [Sulfuricurvum sp.]|nr:hypothetical protein [Sulfuricurvum sp.]
MICTTEPLEWKSGILEMKRDLESGGIFSTFQAESLTFVGNGAQLLRNMFNAYELGVKAKCTLVIYWWKNIDVSHPELSRRYVEFPTRYDINFNFYETVKIGRFFFGVRVKAINSSTQTKLDNRQDIDINVNNQTSIGGEAIPPHYNIETVKKLNYPAIDVNYTAILQSGISPDPHNYYGLPHKAHEITFTSIPLNVKNSQFSETQAVGYLSKVQLAAITPFFKSAIYAHELTVTYLFLIQVTDRYVGSFPWNVQLLKISKNGDIEEVTSDGFGGEEQKYTIDGSVTLSLNQGDELKFVVQSPGIDAHYMAYILRQYVAITEAVVSSPATTTEGLPVYEAIERLAQNMLDTQYPIYSDFFGRTDVYWKPGVKYSAENQLRFAHIQSGLNQRGVVINDSETSLALNFKKLMQSLKAIYNIGYSLQQIEGFLRIRIEEYSFFFQDVQVLDFSSRISKYDIQSQVMPELAPVELKTGYDNFEYLSVNGRAEPNTTIQRTSKMNTDTKWPNISPYRADTKGIIDNLSNPVDISGTTDTKGDSSIFIVKTQKDGTGWKPEQAENITIVDDTSVFKNFLFNRLFTPTRMLYRHGNRIRAGMNKSLDSYLIFQKSDKSSGLITSGDSLTALAENSDILVSTLAAPIYKN